VIFLLDSWHISVLKQKRGIKDKDTYEMPTPELTTFFKEWFKSKAAISL
jgi:hypothetical protein